MKQKKKRPAAAPLGPPEDQRAEAVTVAWMLCALFTLFAEAVGLAVKMWLSYSPDLDTSFAPLMLLPFITLVMGLVSGTACLLLTPLVYRLRKSPPPPTITIVAVLISLAPLATLLLRGLR